MLLRASTRKKVVASLYHPHPETVSGHARAKPKAKAKAKAEAKPRAKAKAPSTKPSASRNKAAASEEEEQPVEVVAELKHRDEHSERSTIMRLIVSGARAHHRTDVVPPLLFAFAPHRSTSPSPRATLSPLLSSLLSVCSAAIKEEGHGRYGLSRSRIQRWVEERHGPVALPRFRAALRTALERDLIKQIVQHFALTPKAREEIKATVVVRRGKGAAERAELKVKAKPLKHTAQRKAASTSGKKATTSSMKKAPAKKRKTASTKSKSTKASATSA